MEMAAEISSLKVAAFCKCRGLHVQVEVEPGAKFANFIVVPAEKAKQAIADLDNGGTAPARALLDAYITLQGEIRNMRRREP